MKRERISLLETNLDHLTGEELGMALEALNDMPEILDALYIPAIGKKNRPAGILQVICKAECEDFALKAIFRHTHTLGIRIQRLERAVLGRHAGEMEYLGEKLPSKEYEIEGLACARPEAEALKKLAREKGAGAPALRLGKWESR